MSATISDGQQARKPYYGFFLAGVSALCYAFLPVLAKMAYNLGATPLELLSLRFLFATPLFWLFSLGFRRRKLLVGWRNVIIFLAVGFFFFALPSISIFYSFKLIQASLAIIILYTYPPLISVWDRLISKHRLNPFRIASLTAAFSGVVLIAGNPSVLREKAAATGICLAITAAVLYSLFSFTAQRIMARSGPLVFTTYSVTATFLLMAFIQPPLEALSRSSPPIVVLAGAIALVSTFLAIYLYMKSIQLIGAARASIVSNLEPVGATLLAYFIIGERLTPVQMAGGLLVLSGVYLLRLEPVDNGSR